MKKILIHVCCGPCGIYPIEVLGEQFEVTAFYFNPNIHPENEYKNRLKAFQKYLDKYKINYLIGEYNPQDYFDTVEDVTKNKGERCPLCYELRLDKTAQTAREKGYDAFTSTLLISPHQDIDLVRTLGENLGEKNKVEFFDGQIAGDKKKYKGFRPGFTEGRKKAKKEALYAQTYCGCLYSQRGL